mmetsp:Transcript_10473/g.17577  ORF Transcript_10473/g.17577 Transcript_10473/m.17577 type:complete len:99 (+) Transcript_10473:224-520(+)
MVAGDRAKTEALFLGTKSQVEALEAQIAQKNQQIEELKVPGAAVPSGSGVVGYVPPPPGPPPSQPQLPSGWKKATTPEGKEYYYHETTGETSWSVPVS